MPTGLTRCSPTSCSPCVPHEDASSFGPSNTNPTSPPHPCTDTLGEMGVGVASQECLSDCRCLPHHGDTRAEWTGKRGKIETEMVSVSAQQTLSGSAGVRKVLSAGLVDECWCGAIPEKN